MIKNTIKTTALSLILVNTLYAVDWSVTCTGEQTASNISTLDYAFSGEWNDETTVYGELDTCNYSIPFWDSNSPACGGTGTDNILLEIMNTACNDDAFIFTVGDTGGFAVHRYNADTSQYENATIFVNGYPCMPSDKSSITVAFYDWNDNSNIGLVTAYNINNLESATNYSLTTEEQTTLKSICAEAPEPSSELDYTPLLNQIITNTAPNSDTVEKLTNIDNRQQKQDDDLDTFITSKSIDTMMNIDTELDGFNTTFETTLSDTYSTYSDIFGFGGYGVAPDPISFTMFAKEYKVFDPTVLNPHIEMIRDTFAIFAYLWGFIIVFKNS
ncbi:MAG: hypothetical protein U9Q20_08210 [Campylobacterota bacterium]|nr:hypothetical protein [Campylobacterota bacterium]